MAKPWYVELLEEHDPEMARTLASNREFALREGEIPAKYKILMTMLVDAILAHEDGVRALAEQARGRGASELEINETLRLAYDCGGTPALITALAAFRQ